MIETERLILRPLIEADADSVFAMRSDSEIMRFIRAPQRRQNEASDWINLVSSRWETENIGFCAVIEKTSDTFIGWCGLWRLKETDEIEIGYAIAKDYRKQGFAFESAAAILEFGFRKLSLGEIVAVAFPKNLASQNVMKSVGMTYDYTGEFYGLELVHYSISKSVWQNRENDGANNERKTIYA